MRQKLGVAWKGETCAVLKRLLVDRRGADGRCLSRHDQPNRPLDHRNHARSVCRIRLAGQGGGGEVLSQNRQGTLSGGFTFPHRTPISAGRQVPGVADPDEPFAHGPGLRCKLRAHA
jgi:hypothetical protein